MGSFSYTLLSCFGDKPPADGVLAVHVFRRFFGQVSEVTGEEPLDILFGCPFAVESLVVDLLFQTVERGE